ncbi:MAG: regulatory protein RecX [Desulfococcaceae bacterium]
MKETEDSSQDLKKAMDTVIRILARRSHACAEIRQKLRQRGFGADIIHTVISECERLHYIDDGETACQYFRELKNKGCGPQRIRADMKKKGLWGDRAESLISEYAESKEEKEIARNVLEKKKTAFDREKEGRKRKEKIFRFLSSRGFSGSVISDLIRSELFRQEAIPESD